MQTKWATLFFLSLSIGNSWSAQIIARNSVITKKGDFVAALKKEFPRAGETLRRNPRPGESIYKSWEHYFKTYELALKLGISPKNARQIIELEIMADPDLRIGDHDSQVKARSESETFLVDNNLWPQIVESAEKLGLWFSVLRDSVHSPKEAAELAKDYRIPFSALRPVKASKVLKEAQEAVRRAQENLEEIKARMKSDTNK